MSKTTGESQAIRAFVDAHQNGWNHDDWMGFLHQLSEAGHQVSDPDGIGLALERERIRSALRRAGIKGLGPKRIESVAAGYGGLNQLRSVEATHIAGKAGIPVKLAEAVVSALR